MEGVVLELLLELFAQGMEKLQILVTVRVHYFLSL
jgi:hypothetical protein